VSYSGQIIELPVGNDGLTGTKNLSQAKPQQLLQATNLTYENGTLQKEGGTALYSSGFIVSSGTSILAGVDWNPSEGVQRQIIVAGTGRVLRDTGAGTFPVTMVNGLNFTDTVPVFVEGGAEAQGNARLLFLISEKNEIHTVSGDSTVMQPFASGAADWTGSDQPVSGMIHEGRLWACKDHRWYYSRTTNHKSFVSGDAGQLNVYPGEGEELVGGVSFKGVIVTWKKPLGIYIIDTSSVTISQWRVTRLTGAIGGFSPYSAVIIDDDILFMDNGGNLHLISTITEFGDIGSRNLSQIADLGPFIRENFNLAKLDIVRSVYYSAKRQAHFAMASLGSTPNNRRLVVDFNRLDIPRFSVSDRDRPQSMWLRKDANNIPRPIYGSDQGRVYLMDQDSRSHAGAAYNGQFQTPHTDLSFADQSLGTKRKLGDFLELVVEPKGNWNLNVDILWDGAIRDTVAFNMGETGGTLGSFILDTDVLGGDQVLNKKRRITGGGRRISLQGRNSGLGEDFSVAKMYLHFRVSDERLEA